jgi:XTP/dITP diphosphohydrolase
VVFHSRVAAERTDGTGFTVDDVAAGIVDKMIRRHPHVFADVAVDGAADVTANWDEIKAAERAAKHGDDASALQGVPTAQPALALAAALQRRAVRAGLPPDLVPVPGDDLGARLFNLVAADPGAHAEEELRAVARAFRTRFQRAESGGASAPDDWRAAWPAS